MPTFNDIFKLCCKVQSEHLRILFSKNTFWSWKVTLNFVQLVKFVIVQLNFTFHFPGDATDIRYLVMTNCDLQMVGDEFSRKPYAIAVQQGSPLKDQFNNA